MKKQTKGKSFVSDMSDSLLFGDIAPTKEEVAITQNAAGSEVELPIESLEDYHNHTFKVVDNQDMDALVESIKENGLLLPILVRKKDNDKYEIIAGHRRTFAAKKLGFSTIKAKIVDVDDSTADIMMVDTNLHRESISPSERGRSYKIKLEAMNHQGKKTVLDGINSSKTSLELLSEDVNDSAASIKRYVRLTYLNNDLLDMVDEKKIGLIAGVALSYLSDENQAVLSEFLKENPISITPKLADKIRNNGNKTLTKEQLLKLIEKKGSSGKTKKITFNEKLFDDVLPDSIKKLPIEKRIDFHKKAIQYYLENHE